MTDSKTVVEDLAAWLTGIWDEEERLATEAGDEDPHWSPVDYPYEGISIYSDPTTGGVEDAVTRHIGLHDPASVLARIAADRKILALHSFHMVSSLDSRLQPIPGSRRPHCDTCASQDENGEDWPCVTVRLLAEPQADKPGFRPEWLVERQGVEQ